MILIADTRVSLHTACISIHVSHNGFVPRARGRVNIKRRKRRAVHVRSPMARDPSAFMMTNGRAQQLKGAREV